MNKNYNLLAQDNFMISNDIVIENATVRQYFEALNNGNFQVAAELFSSEGVLYPPFHDPVVGGEAIAQYLETEAQGIKLFPLDYNTQVAASGEVEYVVLGKVQTSLLNVNASWNIRLNNDKKIQSAKIKLLASLVDLLNLRSKKEG
jgi:SnoaL-like domain